MRTLASLMDFSQSALFLDFRFQFVTLRLLICVCTQFHHLFFGLLLVDFTKDCCQILDLLFFYYPFYLT